MKSNTNKVIQVKNLSKAHTHSGTSTFALKNLNLTIHSGEFVAVVGKSGSGKSTLINLISGMDTPTTGEILVGDQTLGKHNHWLTKLAYCMFDFHPTDRNGRP